MALAEIARVSISESATPSTGAGGRKPKSGETFSSDRYREISVVSQKRSASRQFISLVALAHDSVCTSAARNSEAYLD